MTWRLSVEFQLTLDGATVAVSEREVISSLLPFCHGALTCSLVEVNADCNFQD